MPEIELWVGTGRDETSRETLLHIRIRPASRPFVAICNRREAFAKRRTKTDKPSMGVAMEHTFPARKLLNERFNSSVVSRSIYIPSAERARACLSGRNSITIINIDGVSVMAWPPSSKLTLRLASLALRSVITEHSE